MRGTLRGNSTPFLEPSFVERLELEPGLQVGGERVEVSADCNHHAPATGRGYSGPAPGAVRREVGLRWRFVRFLARSSGTVVFCAATVSRLSRSATALRVWVRWFAMAITPMILTTTAGTRAWMS